MNIFRKIINFILGNSKTIDTTPTYSSVVDTPVAQMKKAKQKALQYKEDVKEKNYVTFDQLEARIRNNIFFLENLIVSLDTNPQYLKYKNKVLDLKKQSEDSLKIMLRINKNAPYYQATMQNVVKHTNTVSKLVNIPY